MDFGNRKRGQEGFVNGAAKRYKQESESFATGIGSKTKPCMKFFSTTGCSYGESCRFLHYVPGGFNAVSQMTNMPSMPSFHPPPRNNMGPPPFADGPPSAVKTKLCNRFSSAEGCKYGDKCHFAHGEMELGRPTSFESRGPMMPPQRNNFAAAASFGASATTKIAISAALAGPIIGKGGSNSKQICRLTGVKLHVRDNESDPSQKNIELEGSFDQIEEASAMVRQIIMGLNPTNNPPPVKANMANQARNSKTKVCTHFMRGTCNYGDKCNFSHDESEMRNNQVA